jgi:hypothetical protein
VFLARKLDRALVNDLGPSTFPQTMMEFLPPGVYDHAAISISPPKPFIFFFFFFFNFWTNHVGFLNLVEQAWNQEVHGVPMFILHKKLKILKAHLKLKESK